MGKKGKKKARGGHKEKRVVTPSEKTVSQQNIPSTETVDDRVPVVKERKLCTHLDKGVDLAKVSSKIGSSESIRCEDCRESVSDRRGGKGMGKHGKKKGGGSSDSMAESKAIWVCLECGHLSCGGIGFPTTPQSHAVRHAKQTRHPLAVQFENPKLCWCFPCAMLIPHKKSEENGEEKEILSDIVKIMKGRSSEGASVNDEDGWFGSGSLTGGIKSDDTVSGYVDGRGGYVVRGLANLGNTCFFNSIMQNLLAMGRLRDYFSESEWSFGPLTVSLKKLYDETVSEAGLRNVINPRSFFGCVCAKAPQFRGYQQHDSHELLRCLLDGLSTEEARARKQISYSPKDKNGVSPNMGPTFVDAIFGGQLSSTVCCLECGHSSTVYEPFLDLSLPIPTKKPPSKKAKAISQAKKSKMPQKTSGRVRPKVNSESNSIPPISGESSCQPQSSLPVAKTMVASSGVSTSLDFNGQKGKASENLSANQESINEQFPVNVTKEKVGSSDDFTWWDYLEPGTALNDHDTTSQINSESVIKFFGNENTIHNEVSLCNNFERNSQACAFYSEKTTTLDNHDTASQVNDESVIRSSGNKEAVQNLQSCAESSSRICSPDVGSDQKVDSLGNSCEDELPLLVQDSEVLLLPYKEEGEISSSSTVHDQDSMEFDGFGGLFNEPEVVEAPNSNPVSIDDSFLKNQVRNSSESDPDEIDNSNSPVSISSCLVYFTKPELLTNEHGWHCENCSKAVHAEKMKSRKSKQKPFLKIETIKENGVQADELGSNKDCPSQPEVRNVLNGNINKDVYSTSDDRYVLCNSNNDGKESGFLETTQLEEEKLTSSTSSYKTCSQGGFIDHTNDSCSANGHNNGGSNMDTVRNMAFQFTGEDESEGSEDEEMDSEIVKVKRDASKRILINRAPPILTIHLKRFAQDTRGRLNKLNGHVDFRDTIDIGPYMDTRYVERETHKYRLMGVVEHLGTMRGGHYVAYVRGGAKGTEKNEEENGDFVWYHASDAYVHEVSLEQVLHCEAYILFYERF